MRLILGMYTVVTLMDETVTDIYGSQEGSPAMAAIHNTGHGDHP